MLGNEYVLSEALKHYPGLKIDNITYEISQQGELTRIKMGLSDELNCPIYCLFDGYHMLWYGDHGSFTFDCTWKVALDNIPFNSPSYLFEKLDNYSHYKQFNYTLKNQQLIKELKETSWWEEEVEEELKDGLLQYFTERYMSFWEINTKNLDEDMLERVKELFDATDEYEYITACRNLCSEDPFSDDDYYIYSLGEEITPHYWLILYLLSVVKDKEELRKNDCTETKEQ